MGLLVDGVWQDHDRDIAGAGGTFARTRSTFRNWVTADGAPLLYGKEAEGFANPPFIAAAGHLEEVNRFSTTGP